MVNAKESFIKEASEAKLPLTLPRVSVEDSPDLRRLMARLRRIIERAESDREYLWPL